MSLLVIGLSHHTAPLALLEALSERPDRVASIATAVLASATATEAVVLATCNRLEVYAEVPAFHPAVAAIGEALALAAGTRRAGRRRDAAAPSDPAEELATRAEGSPTTSTSAMTTARWRTPSPWPAASTRWPWGSRRSSVRCAMPWRWPSERGQAGESLNALFQQALRVGKRAHSETDIDQHSVSLVQMALEEATRSWATCAAAARPWSVRGP